MTTAAGRNGRPPLDRRGTLRDRAREREVAERCGNVATGPAAIASGSTSGTTGGCASGLRRPAECRGGRCRSPGRDRLPVRAAVAIAPPRARPILAHAGTLTGTRGRDDDRRPTRPAQSLLRKWMTDMLPMIFTRPFPRLLAAGSCDSASACWLLALGPAAGPGVDTTRREAILIDMTNRHVLFGIQRRPVDADAIEMSKIKTIAHMVFEALEEGGCRLDDALPVKRTGVAQGRLHKSASPPPSMVGRPGRRRGSDPGRRSSSRGSPERRVDRA